MAAIFIERETGKEFKTVFNEIYLNLQKGDEFEYVSREQPKTDWQEGKPSVIIRGSVLKVVWSLDEQKQELNKKIYYCENK